MIMTIFQKTRAYIIAGLKNSTMKNVVRLKSTFEFFSSKAERACGVKIKRIALFFHFQSTVKLLNFYMHTRPPSNFGSHQCKKKCQVRQDILQQIQVVEHLQQSVYVHAFQPMGAINFTSQFYVLYVHKSLIRKKKISLTFSFGNLRKLDYVMFIF